MARCFPYPLPEGYLGDGACGGRSLLGPIKPHAETERTGQGRKDTEISLKRKGSRGHESEKTLSKKIKFTKNSGGSGKGVAEEAESSGVTEEHGQPSCGQSPSHSSDSVKGTGDECPATAEVKKCKKFRIKLNVSKPKEPVSSQQPSVPSASVSQPKVVNRVADVGVSTSASALTKKKGDDNILRATPKVVVNRVSIPVVAKKEAGIILGAPPKVVVNRVADVGVSTSAKKEEDIKVGTAASHISRDKTKERKLSKSEVYNSLTNGWTPPALQLYQTEAEDLDWLLPSKKQPGRVCGGDVSKESCNVGACATWPRAQYMPSVDVYALPYTIPF